MSITRFALTSVSALVLSLVSSFCIFGTQLLAVPEADAQDVSLPAGNTHVQAKLISDMVALQPPTADGQLAGRIGIHFTIQPGWHIYWENSGEAAIPTSVKWVLPQGWSTSELRWPAPFKFAERGNITTYGYRDEVLLIADLKAPLEIPAAPHQVTIAAKLRWLVCKDICVPGSLDVSESFAYSSSAPSAASPEYFSFDKWDMLTPKPLPAAAEQIAGGLELKTRTVHTPGETPQPAFLLSLTGALKPADVPASALQFFPGASTKIGFNHHPRLLTSAPGSYDILVPYKALAASSTETTATGALVIAGTLAGLPRDVTIRWSAPIPADAPADAAPSLDGSTELGFRLFADTAAPKTVKPSGVPMPVPGSVFSIELLAALGSAFIAGFILNFMPCVLPVITIKVMGFFESANKPRREAFGAALAYTAGILASFSTLATAVVIVRSLGKNLSWGFQFQYPGFVLTLVVVLFLLTLGFFEVYQVKMPFMQQANRAMARFKHPFVRHFFDGVLATALSTPCTAPFLGTAVAFSLTQPPFVIYLVFATVGLGLALPYLLFAASPGLLRLLPKPGTWMDVLKQFMGFSLLATIIWLLSVLDVLTESGVIWALVLLVFVFFLLWVRSTLEESSLSNGKKSVVFLIALAAVAAGSYTAIPKALAKRTSQMAGPSTGGIAWQAYAPDLAARMTNSGRPVFIDFTAAWCITCKANENLVIETADVTEAIKSLGIVPLKADFTAGDQVVAEALTAFGGVGVPHYVVLPPAPGEPIVLPTVLTKDILLDALRKGAAKSR